MTRNLIPNVNKSWRARALALLLISAIAVSPWTVKAFETDDDGKWKTVNGHNWYSYSWLSFDSGQGGWVYWGGSETWKWWPVDYGDVRARGVEACAIIGETDEDWDVSSWGTASNSYSGSGSGYSSMGNCSWNQWQPCKTFSAKGSHRVDDYTDHPWAASTNSTEAWVLEPVCN